MADELDLQRKLPCAALAGEARPEPDYRHNYGKNQIETCLKWTISRMSLRLKLAPLDQGPTLVARSSKSGNPSAQITAQTVTCSSGEQDQGSRRGQQVWEAERADLCHGSDRF